MLESPWESKGICQDFFKLKEGGLAREGLIGNGVNLKLSYFYWKPLAWLLHSWA